MNLTLDEHREIQACTYAGIEECIKISNLGSTAKQSFVKHCAKRRNLEIFFDLPLQKRRKIFTIGAHTIRSIKSVYLLVRMTNALSVPVRFFFLFEVQ